MIIKLVGIGFKGYVRDSFNIFDGTIVILSIVELIISSALDVGSGGAFKSI